ncbi:MAG TPA: hypothetical protein VGN04_07265 [Herbaspirillum sp.]|jgi:hypothetical protein
MMGRLGPLPFKWLLLLLIPILAYGGNRLYQEAKMPPPLVFLIPDHYVGPVYFFFGQADGIDVQPDPLGQAVWVPENGVIKIKAQVDSVMGTSSKGHRATYMIAVSDDGKRSILKMFINPEKRSDGWWWGYFDEHTQLHEFKMPDSWGKFSYVPSSLMNERMIFNHTGCREQGFAPGVRDLIAGDKTADEIGAPACGKFLVASPDEYLKFPSWMWEDIQGPYHSIQEFVDEANLRVKKKKAAPAG